jgi:hypothetical protein
MLAGPVRALALSVVLDHPYIKQDPEVPPRVP